MSVFTDMQEISDALERNETLTKHQLYLACDAVLARPTGSTRFATNLIYKLGLRVMQAEAKQPGISALPNLQPTNSRRAAR